MKLFARYFLILTLFATLPLLGVGAWILAGRNAVKDNARHLHERLAALTVDQAERELEQLNRSLTFIDDLDRAQGIPRLERNAMNRALNDAAIVYLSLIDAAGHETAYLTIPELSASGGASGWSQTLIAEALKTKLLMFGAVRPVAEISAIPVAHPLSDGRCVYMIYSLQGLVRRMKMMGDSGSGRLLFVDKGGQAIAGIGGAPPFSDWRLPATETSAWYDAIEGPEQTWVAAAAPVKSLGWQAVSLQTRQEAYSEENANALNAAFFLIFLFLLVLSGSYVLSSRLVKPIELLLAGATRVAANDFSRSVPPLGAGEFERLRVTFNEMADRVGRYQKFQYDKILEEKAKIDALVNNIPEGVLLVGKDARLLYFNAIASRILRKSASAKTMQGMDVLRVPQLLELLKSIQPGTKDLKGGVEMRIGEGAEMRIYLCQALSVARDREEIGVLILMRDVTVERELEKVKVDFFHEIVHDLRGPLTVIDGMVSIQLRKAAAAPADSRYLKMVKYASTQLSSLVSDILDIAKMNSGTMKLAIQKTNATAIISAVQSMYQIPGETKRVTVETAVADGIEFDCDAGLVERVLMNLSGNALKFTPEGGKITLGCTRVGAEIEFSVSDTGPGIPVDKQEAVFDRFKQLDRDEASRKGYGLGLSICRRIVDMHFGRIWVESAVGGGSRFVFRIPAERKTPAPPTLSSPA
jgi:two-component system sensor histidine kinase ResE